MKLNVLLFICGISVFLNMFKQCMNKIQNEDFIKTILDKLIKFSEDVGIGEFSYCAKSY